MLQLSEEVVQNMQDVGVMLNGVILKKAESSDSFAEYYFDVMQRFFELESWDGDEFLSVLGEIGG